MSAFDLRLENVIHKFGETKIQNNVFSDMGIYYFSHFNVAVHWISAYTTNII